MNSAHIAATGGLTAALAKVILWHFSGPIDGETAMSAAALIFAGLGWLALRFPAISHAKGILNAQQ